MERGQGRGRGDVGAGADEAGERDHLAGHVDGVGRGQKGGLVARHVAKGDEQAVSGLFAEGRARVRQEGAEADHVEFELAEADDVARQIAQGLTGDADHDAAADFETEFAQPLEDLRAAGRVGRARGVDAFEEGGVRGLEAQEVAVGACVAESAEFVAGALSQAEGDGERRLSANGGDEFAEVGGVEAQVFARLQNDRSESGAHGLLGAGEDLLEAHAVALLAGGGAQAAVGAQARAVIGDFDESAQLDGVADFASSDFVGHGEELVERGGVFGAQPVEDVVKRERHGVPWRLRPKAAGKGAAAKALLPGVSRAACAGVWTNQRALLAPVTSTDRLTEAYMRRDQRTNRPL